MKIQIKNEILAEGLKRVIKAINWKSPIPILQGVYMECTQDEIILIGSDSNETLRTHIPVGEFVDVITPGKVVLPQQAVDIIIKKLKKKKILIELVEATLTIKYGKKSEIKLITFDAEEYPKLPSINLDKPTFVLSGKEFYAGVSKTIFTASDSETRPILQGVNIKVSKDCITFVSTDAHRLGQVKINKNNEEEMQLVVPAKSLDTAAKTFDLQEDVFIYCEENTVVIKSEFSILYIRLLEGNYPETSRLIPTDYKTEVKVNREELLECIDRISGIADASDSSKGVINCHINGAVELSTASSQLGKGIETIEYEDMQGDEIQISFSSRFITEALKSMNDNEVSLKFCGQMRPFVVVPTESESDVDVIQLILPVRTI